MSNVFRSMEEGSEGLEPVVSEQDGGGEAVFRGLHGFRAKVLSYLMVMTLTVRAAAHIALKHDVGHLKLQVRLLIAALFHAPRVAQLLRLELPALKRIASERPEMVIGPLLWPYLCASWGVEERLRCIRDHYLFIGERGAPFPFAVDERLVLAVMDEVYPGLRIIMDQPLWLIREGGLTISLFINDFRAYSMAFSFMQVAEKGGICCMIGSIQGRNSEGITDLYRRLTKVAHGLRPRDLLMEVCRILCRQWNVQSLSGVRDSERYDRHPFFAGHAIDTQNYDAIWQDRGGTQDSQYFYAIPLAAERRKTAEIKSNKRSLYRQRYQLLDALEADVASRLPRLQPQRFMDR